MPGSGDPVGRVATLPVAVDDVIPTEKDGDALESAAKSREETSGSAETTLPGVQCAFSERYCKHFVRCNTRVARHQA